MVKRQDFDIIAEYLLRIEDLTATNAPKEVNEAMQRIFDEVEV